MGAKTSTNPNDFILPDLGEGVHEAELIKWRVAEGDAVKEHDILAEMETDKALVEVPSPRDGVIAKLHGSEGEIMHVGNPLVTYVADDGATPAPAKSNGKASAAPDPQPEQQPDQRPEQQAEEREDAGTVVGDMSGGLAGVTASEGKALATPAVRRLARDLGVDINACPGTGIGGRVTEKDVRAFVDSSAGTGGAPAGEPAVRSSPNQPHARSPRPQPAVPTQDTSRQIPAPAPSRQPASFPAGEDAQRVPFRGVRRTIANRLRQSVDQAVHFNVMDEADVAPLDRLRKQLAGASGEKVSFLPFVASAVCRVLTDQRFRALNATVDEDPNNPDGDAFIVQHRAVHLGIATDTDSGLMVPVIRDADALGVLEISRHIAHTAASARDRSIPREQLVGSTFTISNVGSHAGRFATPIINYPEAAILAVGRARQAPVVRHGGIFVGNLLPLSLACDHRVVDGATAALALAEIIRLLQDPESLLTPARG